MGITEQIRVLCVRCNISNAELARRLNVSPQAFSGKMKRESFTISDLEEIAEAVGVEFRHDFILKNGDII
ncbi:MAG: helix-turn-helix domain-containing protein [Anaerovoracaceae bacterium]